MTVRSVKIYKDRIVNEVQRSAQTRVALAPLAAKATRTAKKVAHERVQRRTGRYEDSFKSHVAVGHGHLLARITTENTAPYAGYIERGTRPHVMPRKAGVYVFDADNGTTVFTHGPIRHPGTRAERVIEVALKRVAAGGGF